MNMNIKSFVEHASIDVNDTHKWILLIDKFIKKYNLQSIIFENDEGMGITIYSKEEEQLLGSLLYEVEETKTTLNYIFEGNIKYNKEGFND